MSINTGYIVWVNGPWPAAIADKIIYNQFLSTKLTEGETVAADNGYHGCPQAVQPAVGQTWLQKKQKSQANGRHETINGRLKQFAALDNRFRELDAEKHRSVFVAITVLTQIDFELQRTTFDVKVGGNFD